MQLMGCHKWKDRNCNINLFLSVILCTATCVRILFPAREKIVGWYHTGPKLHQNDVAINELIRRYCPNSVLVIIDAKPKDLGLPTEAYRAVEEVHDVSDTWIESILFCEKRDDNVFSPTVCLRMVLQRQKHLNMFQVRLVLRRQKKWVLSICYGTSKTQQLGHCHRG